MYGHGEPANPQYSWVNVHKKPDSPVMPVRVPQGDWSAPENKMTVIAEPLIIAATRRSACTDWLKARDNE